jgi:hypothetical protein
MTTRAGASKWACPQPAGEPADGLVDADVWRVLQLAKGVDHDAAQVHEWYMTEQIRELGGKTAHELVQMGDADLVIGFLRSIRRGHRD